MYDGKGTVRLVDAFHVRRHLAHLCRARNIASAFAFTAGRESSPSIPPKSSRSLAALEHVTSRDVSMSQQRT
jgi:hypothetical protein